MSESKYWFEALRLIDDKTRMQRYNSRVSMALHNAKIHRPSVYVSAKATLERMLEFKELNGHIPRTNLPLFQRKKRNASFLQGGDFEKTTKPPRLTSSEVTRSTFGTDSLEGMPGLPRSLVCSRCKLADIKTPRSKETTKIATKDAKTDKKSDKKEVSTTKTVHCGAVVSKQPHLQSEKESVSCSTVPSSRQTRRVTEKSNPNVNRLISLLHALDDYPKKKARAKSQESKQSEPKRRMKLSKPGRMIDTGELILLQGDLRLRKILVKEDKILSSLLHVSSKRPTPLYFPAVGKLASSIRSEACGKSEQSPKSVNTESEQYENDLECKWKDQKQSSRYRSKIGLQKVGAPNKKIAQVNEHKKQQEPMFPVLEYPLSEDGDETFKQWSLPPIYISHHCTTCPSHKQNISKETEGKDPKETRKSKGRLPEASTCSKDHRMRNGGSEGKSSQSLPWKGAHKASGLPHVVIPRATTPLRGFTPWTDVTPSPCMFSYITEDGADIQ